MYPRIVFFSLASDTHGNALIPSVDTGGQRSAAALLLGGAFSREPSFRCGSHTGTPTADLLYAEPPHQANKIWVARILLERRIRPRVRHLFPFEDMILVLECQ